MTVKKQQIKQKGNCYGKTICTECKHHGAEDNEYVCYARTFTVTQWSDGYTEKIGVQKCDKVNRDGKCLYYEYQPEKKLTDDDFDF